jgi:hypothetical protein
MNKFFNIKNLLLVFACQCIVIVLFGQSQGAVNKYALLQETLDGSVHIAYDKNLWIKYNENYEVGPSQKLRYVIYDALRRVIVKTDENGIPNIPSAPSVSIKYGENHLRLSLSGCPGIVMWQYYYLEVWNEKGRRWYLRFYCEHSIPQ